MTWSRFDDAAPKHPKAGMAGNEAWGLWAAAVMYCNRYLTDGFVPTAALARECLPVPITPSKAKKLAEQLCEARLRPEDPGLFERVEGGYRVHDFLDWNPSKAEVESKRKADRERKKTRPDSGGSPVDIPSGIPNGIPTGRRADSEAPRASAHAPARASRPAQPFPAIPDPNDEEGSSSVFQKDLTDSDDETPIPLDLVERAERLGVFSSMLARMPGVHVEQLRDKARGFVAYWAIGGGTGQRRRRWMARLREDIRKAHEQNKLKPIGALEHEALETEGDGPGLSKEQLERVKARRAELDRERKTAHG
jgi:hypothetical protein